MATISRNEYVGLFGPTVGDRIRLGDTGLFVEIERDLRGASGDEIVFGGGKSLREGMGMDNRLTYARRAARSRHHQRDDHRRGAGCGESRRRHSGRAHLRHRQVRQCADDGWHHAGARARSRHRRHLGQPPHHDGGRHRHAYPFHFAATGLRGAVQRHDDTDRGRHGPQRRLERDDGDAGAGQHPEHVARVRRLAGQRRHPRQGARARQGCAGRADRGRRGRLQVPRGLGHDARGAALGAHGGRPDGRPGVHAHRHAERIGLRRGHDRRVRGPHHPFVPYRRLGWRPRAGHHQGVGSARTSCPRRPIPRSPTASIRRRSSTT